LRNTHVDEAPDSADVAGVAEAANAAPNENDEDGIGFGKAGSLVELVIVELVVFVSVAAAAALPDENEKLGAGSELFVVSLEDVKFNAKPEKAVEIAEVPVAVDPKFNDDGVLKLEKTEAAVVAGVVDFTSAGFPNPNAGAAPPELNEKEDFVSPVNSVEKDCVPGAALAVVDCVDLSGTLKVNVVLSLLVSGFAGSSGFFSTTFTGSL